MSQCVITVRLKRWCYEVQVTRLHTPDPIYYLTDLPRRTVWCGSENERKKEEKKLQEAEEFGERGQKGFA